MPFNHKFKYEIDREFLADMQKLFGTDAAMPFKRQPPPSFIKPMDLEPVAPACAVKFVLRPLVDVNGLRCAGLRIEEADHDGKLCLRATCYKMPWRGELTVTGEVSRDELRDKPTARVDKLRRLLGELQYGFVEV